MPKEKKFNNPNKTTLRHAPLGQVYAEDENKSKYATIRSVPRGGKKKRITDDQDEYDKETLLDEKTSRKILELSKEQMLEVELEEQQKRFHERKGSNRRQNDDSSEEEDEDDFEDEDNGDMEEEHDM